MDESKSKEQQQKERRYDPELLKKGLRCDLDQYDMLKKCSQKGDKGIKEWNQWREKEENRYKDIELEGQDFSQWHLKGVFLNKGAFVDEAGTKHNFTGEVHLNDAIFHSTKLQGAIFHNTRLQGARFAHAHLEKAIFQGAHLQGANFYKAELMGTNFKYVILDNATSFVEIKVDRETDFRCVGLEGARIDPGTKQLLEYNIRRMNWQEWYEEHKWLKWLVKPFWLISDYGLSTRRIIFTFFGLALVFANIYYYWGRIAPPGIVDYLFVDRNGVPVEWWLVPLRTLYFSIVTMTTLGFGDMYANAHSIFGHILLSFQVILGYVLLGALVTRFAVLFTAGGPAGKFADEKGEKDETE